MGMRQRVLGGVAVELTAQTDEEAEPVTPQQGVLPESLRRLLYAAAPERDAAWEAFVAEFSFLLLHVARDLARDSDERMDLYARMLEVLRARECQRLRAYATHPDTKFTTWLVVVARRIGVDWHRSRFGRRRAGESESQGERRAVRRTLEDLLTAGDDPATIAAEPDAEPDAALVTAELNAALQGALAALAPADRLLLKLRFDDDLSAAEIAALLHLPSQFHVYRRIKVLLRDLKGDLSARGIEDAAS